MQTLWIGDPHVQKSNLEESKRLFAWILKLSNTRQARVLIAGDLYNDFSLVRVEVEEFWHQTFTNLNESFGHHPIVIEGNHDQTPDGKQSALTVHEHHCDLIQRPCSYGTVGFLPFIRDNEKFAIEALSLYNQGIRTIYCHAEFQGSKYDNGFYAPHGIELAKFPADLTFISGHIHTQQEFGNVWYPGTPRPLTRSDVGAQKGIWLIDLMNPKDREFIPTPADVSEPFLEFTITEENRDLIKTLPNSDRVYVDVKGSEDFVKATLKHLPEANKVRTFTDTEVRPSNISESEGIPAAFAKYTAQYAQEHQMTDALQKAVLDKVYQKCPVLKVGT